MFGVLATLILAPQPLFAAAAHSAAMDAAAGNPFGGPFVICTAQGQVLIDEQGNPQPVQNQSVKCPLCLAGSCANSAGTAVTPVANTDVVFRDDVLGALRFQPCCAAGNLRSQFLSHSPRGPPVAAV